MDNEIADQLTGVMFCEFGPEVDLPVFGSLPAQLPAPLLLLLLLLRARPFGSTGRAIAAVPGTWSRLQSSGLLYGLRRRTCSAKRRSGARSSHSLVPSLLAQLW